MNPCVRHLFVFVQIHVVTDREYGWARRYLLNSVFIFIDCFLKTYNVSIRLFFELSIYFNEFDQSCNNIIFSVFTLVFKPTGF